MEYINTIIKNAKIYTIDNKNQIQEALVVKDEKIIYVGSNEGADKFISACRKMKHSDDDIINLLIEECSLTKEEAIAKLTNN